MNWLLTVVLAASDPVETRRKIFAAQCAECHNANGDKPLETGLALSERRLDDGDMRQNIAGRLGPNATDEQREAVRQYIYSINRDTRKKD